MKKCLHRCDCDFEQTDVFSPVTTVSKYLHWLLFLSICTGLIHGVFLNDFTKYGLYKTTLGRKNLGIHQALECYDDALLNL